MIPAHFAARVDNWARYCRDGGSRGRQQCGSAEGNFRAPAVDGERSIGPLLDVPDANLVDLAWRRLPLAVRLLVRDIEVYRIPAPVVMRRRGGRQRDFPEVRRLALAELAREVAGLEEQRRAFPRLSVSAPTTVRRVPRLAAMHGD